MRSPSSGYGEQTKSGHAADRYLLRNGLSQALTCNQSGGTTLPQLEQLVPSRFP